jgi:hypothetical protein
VRALHLFQLPAQPRLPQLVAREQLPLEARVGLGLELPALDRRGDPLRLEPRGVGVLARVGALAPVVELAGDELEERRLHSPDE